MRKVIRALGVAVVLTLPTLVAAPVDAEAQGRGSRGRGAGQQDGVTLSVEVRVQIQDFYTNRPATGAEALPPGIRRNLERGKELPPGLAKRSPPEELSGRVELPEGFELIEVGLDVLVVEVATSIIHDILSDIIR